MPKTAKPDADAARKRELSMIHIARTQLAMDEDSYRDLVERISGQRSAANLTAQQRQKVLDHFKACGWKPVSRNPDRKPQREVARSPADEYAERWEKARALWAELAKVEAVREDTDKALLDWVRGQAKVAQWRWLNTHQINNLIESLKRWCQRVGAELQ